MTVKVLERPIGIASHSRQWRPFIPSNKVLLTVFMYCCGQIKLGSNFFYCNKKLFFKLTLSVSVMLCHRYGSLVTRETSF
jgi:hypothetical protein